MKIFTDAQTVRTQIDGFRGLPGRDGRDGKDGRDGADGASGKNGYTPQKGIDYFDGAPGKDGQDGYTPQRGTDYWTAADRQQIVSDVLAQMPESGGSGGSWRFVGTEVLTEEVSAIRFQFSEKDVVLKDIMLTALIQKVEATSTLQIDVESVEGATISGRLAFMGANFTSTSAVKAVTVSGLRWLTDSDGNISKVSCLTSQGSSNFVSGGPTNTTIENINTNRFGLIEFFRTGGALFPVGTEVSLWVITEDDTH